MRIRGLEFLVAAGATVVLTAGGAAAQPSPTAAPHPNMPWNHYNPQGQFMRYIQVPAQQVTIELPAAPAPAAPAASPAEGQAEGARPAEAPKPPEPQKQVVEIPGYVVTETTAGYFYPERWTLQRTAAGGFTWVRLPAQFQRK